MKTPRELLLTRHHRALRKVEAARRRALLETLCPSEGLWWRMALAELFAPQKQLWVTLAAVWVLILGFHLVSPARSGSPPATPMAAAPSAAIDPSLFAALGLPNSDSSIPR
jgi:hypothetical protein